LFRYESRKRTKTNLLVFLRPYVVRDEATSSALAMDRYDYIRGQVANSTLADNLIFRDLQSRQLPEKPPVPPSIRRAESGPRTLQNDLAPGIPAQDPPRQAPAPIIDTAPTTPAPAAPPPGSSAPGSAAPTAGAASGAQPGTAPPGPTVQLLQVASLTDIARAREMQRSLRDAGFDAYWESVKTNTGDQVRVRVSVDQATRSVADTIARLKALGYDPVLVTP
jgi:general secretion pathway protein D